MSTSQNRFDEVHFGKFAAYYISRTYYFDVHPPFAKLLLGLAGWFVGFDGQFNFENIGDSYTANHVPYVGMRALPAIFGSLTVPVVYEIMKESGYSTIVAAFSASLVLFGDSFFGYLSKAYLNIFGRYCPRCPIATDTS
jgi:dolichyl-phosphate-mannose-protein mannosyltransferase